MEFDNCEDSLPEKCDYPDFVEEEELKKTFEEVKATIGSVALYTILQGAARVFTPSFYNKLNQEHSSSPPKSDTRFDCCL